MVPTKLLQRKQQTTKCVVLSKLRPSPSNSKSTSLNCVIWLLLFALLYLFIQFVQMTTFCWCSQWQNKRKTKKKKYETEQMWLHLTACLRLHTQIHVAKCVQAISLLFITPNCILYIFLLSDNNNDSKVYDMAWQYQVSDKRKEKSDRGVKDSRHLGANVNRAFTGVARTMLSRNDFIFFSETKK